MLQSEAMRTSPFDRLQLRRNMWETYNAGGATLKCASCQYGKVLWIQPHGTRIEPPWTLWGRIFQWAGPLPHGMKWTVHWFPADSKRILPPKGQEVGPEHVNGGYCMPCDPRTIVIYRHEEATRVLLHELLHAACTDPQAPLPIKEATTETWAELLLVGLCSKGKESQAKHFWKLQSRWIANQNKLLQESYGVKTPEDYAWRYTVGREWILTSLHIPLPSAHSISSRSSRFTHPDLCV